MGGLGLNTDAHIIINQAGGGQVDGVGGGPHVVAVVVGDGDDDDGVEDGLVSLNTNDDFAMGAPPGAPGAIGETPVAAGLPLLLGQQHHHHHRTQSRGQRSSHHHPHPHHGRGAVDAPDVTPRAGFVGLPDSANATPMRGVQVPSPIASQRTIRRGAAGEVDMAGVTPLVHPTALGNSRSTTSNASTTNNNHRAAGATGEPGTGAGPGGLAATASNAAAHSTSSLSNHPSTTGAVGSSGDNSGPYRDEDVLLALQLLAYLSKYPHVRQAFYKSRVTFHPASVVVGFTSGAGARGAGSSSASGMGASGGVPPPPFSSSGKERGERGGGGGGGKDSGKEGTGAGGAAASFLRSFRGKERATPSSSSSQQQQQQQAASQAQPSSSTSTSNSSSSATATAAGTPGGVSSARQTNVFSLVERFTFKPSSTETELPNPPPRLPPEIQYWAGVIMRNACRKDDGRGGIRQCANSECFLFSIIFSALFYGAICYTTSSLLLHCSPLHYVLFFPPTHWR
jgi:hypothetical protein